MKILIGISLLQLVLIIYLSLQLHSLSTHMSENKASTRDNSNPASQRTVESKSSDDSHVDLLAGFRQIIQDELSALKVNQMPTFDSESSETKTEITEEQRQLEQSLYEDLNMKIDYYLTDGAFSRTEQNEFEENIAKLNQQQRRQALSKLAQKMNAANIQFGY